jgi:hypothetical protein
LKPEPGNRWDSSKLAVNNWFSSTSYYKVLNVKSADEVEVSQMSQQSANLMMSRDILETEMHSALVFEKEEKISRTQVIEKLLEVGETVFTVQFNKKVDEARVKKILEGASAKSDLKKLSKEIVTGEECTLSCFLTSADNQLGRSSIIDVNAPYGRGFRQVDHRTINWLILKNVKYVVK